LRVLAASNTACCAASSQLLEELHITSITFTIAICGYFINVRIHASYYRVIDQRMIIVGERSYFNHGFK
jgi:hypothetical protein